MKRQLLTCRYLGIGAVADGVQIFANCSQTYKKSEKIFLDWLEKASNKLGERTAAKKPIGIIHSEAEDFSVSEGLNSS